MTDKWPTIPQFVLPASRELITDCWDKDPGHRLSFDETVERLKEMKFKLIPGVNSSKISDFVKRIEHFEMNNSVIQQ
jgi:hypothetical protein